MLKATRSRLMPARNKSGCWSSDLELSKTNNTNSELLCIMLGLCAPGLGLFGKRGGWGGGYVLFIPNFAVLSFPIFILVITRILL